MFKQTYLHGKRQASHAQVMHIHMDLGNLTQAHMELRSQAIPATVTSGPVDSHTSTVGHGGLYINTDLIWTWADRMQALKYVCNLWVTCTCTSHASTKVRVQLVAAAHSTQTDAVTLQRR